MKKFILGFLTGIAVASLVFFIWYNNKGNGELVKVSLIPSTKLEKAAVPPKAYPRAEGEKLINRYATTPSSGQPVDCNSFTIDSEGFKQIVDNPKFNGFRIFLGKELGSSKNSIKLLFCGISTEYKPIFYTIGATGDRPCGENGSGAVGGPSGAGCRRGWGLPPASSSFATKTAKARGRNAASLLAGDIT